MPHQEPGWTLAPSILIPLALSLLLYAWGAARLFQRAHGGRTMLWAWPGKARKVIGAWVHSSAMQSSWRFLSGAVTATTLHAAALWLWHGPILFALALAQDGWHIAQHLSFLISALLFWSAMFHNKRAHGGRGLAVLCLFATSVISGALGALMAFSQSPWHPRYASLGLAPFGLTPVEDQQLAGLLMWIPGGLVHAVAALILLAKLLRDSAETISKTPRFPATDPSIRDASA